MIRIMIWRRVHKINNILYISTPWKCKMEHLMSRESVIVMRIPVTVRGEATQAAVLCRYLLTIYWAPGAGMACLSSTVQYWPVHCTLYSTQHRQQRRRRSIASCAISILYLATLATLRHTENKESSDVLLLFIRKYIYQRYLRQLCPLQCSGGPGPLTFESTWGLRVGGGVALCAVQYGVQGCGDPMWRVMCCEWVPEITYISEAFHKSQKHFWVTLQYWVTTVSIVLVFWNVKQVCWTGPGWLRKRGSNGISWRWCHY